MKKKDLSKVDIYKKRQRKAKFLKVLAPIVYWTCITLCVVCLVLAIRNSFGNVAEITSLLNSKKYTGAELQANYQMLIEKYGEWVIGNGSNGFTITFINIGKAVFSGLMISCLIGAVVSGISSVLFGKWLLPTLTRKFTQDNQDMTNLVILSEADKKELNK